MDTNVAGDVIGAHDPIIAAPGDDAILPCHLKPRLDVRRLTVEWSKPDLTPDPSDRLSQLEYVFLYRDQQEVLDMKLQTYVGRTEMFPDSLKRGDMSLKIKNVTAADKGRYRCFIPKLSSTVKDAVVQLSVEPHSVHMRTNAPLVPRNLQTPGPTIETAVEKAASQNVAWIFVGVVFFMILILSGILHEKKSSKRNSQVFQPKHTTSPAQVENS